MELLARVCNTERMNVERLVARLFVAAGGLFWAAAAFGADFAYNDKTLMAAVVTALIPLGITIAALALGWFYEMLTALILGIGIAGVIVWGIVTGWEAGVWITMGSALIAPMAIAALLFMLASRMQRICTLREATTA